MRAMRIGFTALTFLSVAAGCNTSPSDADPSDVPGRGEVKRVLEKAGQGDKDTSSRVREALGMLEASRASVKALNAESAGAAPMDDQIEALVDDEQFADRVWKMLGDYADGQVGPAIFYGEETSDYSSCVAIGCDDHWHCSGVLFARNAVLTASHCFCPESNSPCAATRVAFGGSVESPDLVLEVEGDPIPFTDCPGFAQKEHDICVLILVRDVDEYEPVSLANSGQIDAAERVRVVGFGLDEYGNLGAKRKALINVVSSLCTDPSDTNKYDCIADRELVAAGPLLADTCKGDSGGPAYLDESDDRTIAAITSRPIQGIDQCGHGGIYVRVDKYVDWLRSIPEITWP